MMDRETGRPRGFGFVTVSTAEEANKAIEALDGRALTVNTDGASRAGFQQSACLPARFGDTTAM